MCNMLHSESKSIRKNGKGWKVFRLQDGKLTNLCGGYPYLVTEDEWAKWTNMDYDREDLNEKKGFCFLLSYREAKLLKNLWGDPASVIEKIKYRGGLGKHLEYEIIGNGEAIKIALCKEFSIYPSKNAKGSL